MCFLDGVSLLQRNDANQECTYHGFGALKGGCRELAFGFGWRDGGG